MSVNHQKILYFGLAFAVATVAGLIIFIIVDKTTQDNCGVPVLPENTAGAFTGGEGIIACLPGYAFADGNATHRIVCTSSSAWNTSTLPECIQITNPPLALKCPIQSGVDSNLSGDVVFVETKDHVQVEGLVRGLNSSSIQVINVNNHTDLCYITKPSVLTVTSTESRSVGLNVTDNTAHFNLILEQPLKMNETFSFYARAIGSQREISPRSSKFDGIFVFIVEQQARTIGVFSAIS